MTTDLAAVVAAARPTLTLRDGPGRRTRLVETSLGLLVLKEFAPRRGWRALADRLRGSPARREFRAGQECVRRGVPVPRALGVVGASARGGETLVMEFVPRSVTVREALERDVFNLRAVPSARRRFTIALARFCFRFASAGVAPRDFHLRNVLVREEDGAFRFTLVDFGALRLRPPPVEPLAARQSARLLAWLPHVTPEWVTAADRWRFLRAWADAAVGAGPARDGDSESGPHVVGSRITGDGGSAAGGLVASRVAARWLWRDAADLSPRLWRAFFRGRDRRCLLARGKFVPVGGSGWRGIALALARAGRPEFAPGSGVPALAAACDAAGEGKASRTQRSFWPVVAPGFVEPLFVKWYYPRGWWDRLRALLGWGRARRAWARQNALFARGALVAEPVAFAARPLAPPGGAIGVLATGHATGYQPLDAVIAGASRSERASAARAVARAVSRFHATGFRHGDLKPANVLVARDPGGAGRLGALLVDLDGVRPLPRRAAAREEAEAEDLARLARGLHRGPGFSRTEGARFLLAWAHASGTPGEVARRWRRRMWRVVRLLIESRE